MSVTSVTKPRRSTITLVPSKRRAAALVCGVASLVALAVVANPAQARSVAPRHPAAACTPAAPSVSTRPATAADAVVNRYGDTSGLWSGADSTYSTALPNGRELFSFSDTLIGPTNPDGSRSADTPFVNNSFVVADRSGLHTVIGGTVAAPKSVATPSDPNAWYWSGDPTTSGRWLEVPYFEFHRTGTGVFDFAWKDNALARFDARTLRLVDVTALPSAANIEWGSYTLQDGGWTYLYGVEDLGADKYMHVARVRGTDLRGAWQYFTGSGWSSTESDSVRLMDGVANEYSVSRFGKGYVLITHDTSELLGPHIVAYFSCSPAGPFVNKTVVYTTPETGASGTYGNPNVWTYNAHAHPELSHGNQLLISYNVNSFDINDVFADVTIYRPRFVVATFTGAGLPTSGSTTTVRTTGSNPQQGSAQR
jgi:hypothetical protein